MVATDGHHLETQFAPSSQDIIAPFFWRRNGDDDAPSPPLRCTEGDEFISHHGLQMVREGKEMLQGKQSVAGKIVCLDGPLLFFGALDGVRGRRRGEGGAGSLSLHRPGQ